MSAVLVALLLTGIPRQQRHDLTAALAKLKGVQAYSLDASLLEFTIFPKTSKTKHSVGTPSVVSLAHHGFAGHVNVIDIEPSVR